MLPSPSPSKQPPPKPQPLNFLDERLAVVFPVIQRFKKIITSDPFGITKTWVGADICKYKGFFCDNPPDNSSAIALASLDFNGFQLGAPSISGFIDELPDLALFHANTNNFTGTLTPNISKLPYLYELDLSNNKFTGPFPTAVFGIKNLSFLDIRFNTFTGSVPAQIFSQKLDVLFINNNNFMQTLPQNLGSTTSIYLTLANNKFVGPIPRSIGKASETLIEVLFLNNQLSGCLPYEIGYLNKATVFDAGFNRLTGPIPCSFGCLAKMELFNFAGNMLYGEVPEVVCALGNLVNLSLSDNYFTHVGPMCRKLIKSGVLDVRKNCIAGIPMQRSTVECAMFFAHVRMCPYIASFNIIPCKLAPDDVYGSKSEKSSGGKHSRGGAPSPSYSALGRHRF
ncbi:Leucine-rich repeat [Macleaya cordata]|uniref:Leucine-rich repeat n=1 Tax=Macleaya cordata TaxID=56857 RepID=A0A200QZJ6_MACCD|nr:Leucine-rich repeat [Macleaya cordata]